MTHFYQFVLEYIVVSFILGATWHMVLFGSYYKKLAIYSRIENPRFVFGLTSMLLQGLVFAYVYSLISSPYIFGLGLFLTLASFVVFAEVGKQNTTSVMGFIAIQLAFSGLQAALVTLVFAGIPLWL